jgi:multiple sugar transport system ATP-binding protein
MNLLEHDGVIVGFRPEHFRPLGLARAGQAIPFKFRVELIEFLGSEWILYGKLEGGRFNGQALISRLPATIAAGAPRETDQVYDFAVAEPDLKFFDRETEQRTQPRPVTWQ